MGLFLNMGIIKKCDSEKVQFYLREWKKSNESEIAIDECTIDQQNEDVIIVLNGYGVDSEDFFKYISRENNNVVMYLYIYDGDFWGYFLYDKGENVDLFTPVPDYFEEMDEEEKEKYSGNVNLVTQYFNADKSEIEKFLVIWPEEDEYEEDDDENDEISEYYFDEWAVTSFMKALGYECPQ